MASKRKDRLGPDVTPARATGLVLDHDWPGLEAVLLGPADRTVLQPNTRPKDEVMPWGYVAYLGHRAPSFPADLGNLRSGDGLVF